MPDAANHADRGGLELTCLTFDCETKGIDLERRTVDVVMSTPAVDRHGERVDLDWRLDNFKSNPVVIWAHNSRDCLPLGRAENVRVEAGALRGTIRFASAEANPMAEQCLRLYAEGVLNAVSVGFIPHRLAFEKENGEEILVLSENELVELSVTPTPANPEALARRRAKALETKTTPTPAGPGAPEPATETAMNEKEFATKLEELTIRNSELAIQVGALGGERDAAKKSANELDAKVKSLETENASMKTANAALDSQNKALVTERDAAVAKAAELEAKTIEQEVDALVGKQITAAEKPLFVDLRKSNPDLFTKMVAQRQPMRLEEQVVPNEKTNGKGSTGHLAAKLKGA